MADEEKKTSARDVSLAAFWALPQIPLACAKPIGRCAQGDESMALLAVGQSINQAITCQKAGPRGAGSRLFLIGAVGIPTERAGEPDEHLGPLVAQFAPAATFPNFNPINPKLNFTVPSFYATKP